MTRTTDAIVVPIMPAISSSGLSPAGMLGMMPAAIVPASGATLSAVKTNAMPITATIPASTRRKNWWRPTQKSPSNISVTTTAVASVGISEPSICPVNWRTTSATIAITPMMEVSCVPAMPTIMNNVIGAPKPLR